MDDYNQRFQAIEEVARTMTKKRQRSTPNGAGNKQKKNRVNDKNNNNFLPIGRDKKKTEVQAAKTKPTSSAGLSRTKLELKFDSPDNSLLNNITISENSKFEHPVEKSSDPRKFSPQIDPDSDDFILFNRGGSEDNPNGLNNKILNALQAETSPIHKKIESPFARSMKLIMDEHRAETLRYLEKSFQELDIEGEKRIQVKSYTEVESKILVKFQFKDDNGEVIDDGKENMMSLDAEVYEDAMTKNQNFIIKTSHSIELKENIVMHFISHLRAF